MRKCFFIIFVSLDSVNEVSSAMNLPAASYGVSKWMMAYLPPLTLPSPQGEGICGDPVANYRE